MWVGAASGEADYALTCAIAYLRDFDLDHRVLAEKEAGAMSIQFQSQNFQHILRMCNTNVDGRTKVMYALTDIRGIGRRISNIVCKKCDIDMNKRAGELTTDEVNKIVAVISNPLQFKIPAWMLNRQRDVIDGENLAEVC